tara:strand:- start:1669 stop:2061 length:393 start_codon:yes stop_codon:yes gene_type:complete
MPEDLREVNLAEEAGLSDQPVAAPIEGLISFDELVMNFLQQYEDTKQDYHKLQEALDNMHYTSTITKISLEDLQTKKDTLNKLSGAVEALALFKKHVDPNITDKEFVFNNEEEVNEEAPAVEEVKDEVKN